MKNLSLALLTLILTFGSGYAQSNEKGEPIKTKCIKDGFNINARVVGHKQDLLDVLYGDVLYYSNYPESRDLMGGKKKELNCKDIKFTKNTMSVRFGWKNDMIMIFYFQHDKNQNLIAIYKHLWAIRDGSNIDVFVDKKDDVLVRFGWKKDLYVRFSFDKKISKWRRNSQYRNLGNFPKKTDLTVHTDTIYSK